MKILAISSGLFSPKKGEVSIYRRQRYLNYGLLSLASVANLDPGAVIHGHYDSPADVVGKIAFSYPGLTKFGFMISCPSFLSLPWAREFIEIASQKFPGSSFALGGRWVVNGNSDIIKSLMPQLNYTFEGLGESGVVEFIGKCFGFYSDARGGQIYEQYNLSCLDYTKLDEVNCFVPSFEGSRGCGAGCSFCVEADVKLSKIKPPEVLCQEIDGYLSVLNNPIRRFYLEASNFTPRLNWIESFIKERASLGQEDIVWRTEARVDIFSEKSVVALARAGLRVLDLGLESASPRQLLLMHKTKNPLEYINRATRLVRVASDCGIMVKVNILFYPAESEETVAETVEWLRLNSKYICGVSVYPTIYYGLNPERDQLFLYYRSLGASLANNFDSPIGVHNLNLSSTMSYSDSLRLSLEVSREFMTDRQYFDLKSFSYFDPSYTYSDFRGDLICTDRKLLPFSLIN